MWPLNTISGELWPSQKVNILTNNTLKSKRGLDLTKQVILPVLNFNILFPANAAHLPLNVKEPRQIQRNDVTDKEAEAKDQSR